MKAKRRTVTGKLVNLLIVALVLTGTALVAGIGDVAQGSSIMVRLFLGFLGAIIAIQIIPCLILFGAMAKGVFDLVRGKKASQAEAEESA
jgi:ABC-type Na+ efflux pump permease subunit